MALLHLAFVRDWDPAADTYVMSTRGRTIAEIGFMHTSRDEDQLERVAQGFYGDVTEPLVVLELSEAVLAREGFEVRYEPAFPDDPDSEHFPHVYGGDVPTSAVTDSRPYVVPGRPTPPAR